MNQKVYVGIFLVIILKEVESIKSPILFRNPWTKFLKMKSCSSKKTLNMFSVHAFLVVHKKAFCCMKNVTRRQICSPLIYSFCFPNKHIPKQTWLLVWREEGERLNEVPRKKSLKSRLIWLWHFMFTEFSKQQRNYVFRTFFSWPITLLRLYSLRDHSFDKSLQDLQSNRSQQTRGNQIKNQSI